MPGTERSLIGLSAPLRDQRLALFGGDGEAETTPAAFFPRTSGDERRRRWSRRRCRRGRAAPRHRGTDRLVQARAVPALGERTEGNLHVPASVAPTNLTRTLNSARLGSILAGNAGTEGACTAARGSPKPLQCRQQRRLASRLSVAVRSPSGRLLEAHVNIWRCGLHVLSPLLHYHRHESCSCLNKRS